jgi:hypothetical protein
MQMPIAINEAKKEQPTEMKEFFTQKEEQQMRKLRHKYRSPRGLIIWRASRPDA